MGVKRKPIQTKLKPIKTNEMEVAISKLFGIRKHIIVPNVSWGLIGMHECDLFLIKSSGVAVEVEIKISRSDFLADFKKGHNHIDKHNRITEFYYAFPKNIYEKCKEEIPEHAGIIICERYVNYKKIDMISAQIKRSPKRIKGARKLTIEEQLKVARLGVMRIMTLKSKIITLQNKISDLNNNTKK